MAMQAHTAGSPPEENLCAISASYDKSIRFWDVSTGQTLRSFTFPDSQVNYLHVLPETNALAVAAFNVIRLFSLNAVVGSAAAAAGGGGGGGLNATSTGNMLNPAATSAGGGGGSGQPPPPLASFESTSSMNFTSLGSFPLRRSAADPEAGDADNGANYCRITSVDSLTNLHLQHQQQQQQQRPALASFERSATTTTTTTTAANEVGVVLFATSEDGHLRFFDARAHPALQLLRDLATGIAITCSALSADRRLLFTGNQVGHLTVWHLPSIIALVVRERVQAEERRQRAASVAAAAAVSATTSSQSNPLNISPAAENPLSTDAAATGTAAAAEGEGSEEARRKAETARKRREEEATIELLGLRPLQDIAFEGDFSSIRSIDVDPLGRWVVVATNSGTLHFLRCCNDATMGGSRTRTPLNRHLREVTSTSTSANPHNSAKRGSYDGEDDGEGGGRHQRSHSAGGSSGTSPLGEGLMKGTKTPRKNNNNNNNNNTNEEEDDSAEFGGLDSNHTGIQRYSSSNYLINSLSNTPSGNSYARLNNPNPGGDTRLALNSKSGGGGGGGVVGSSRRNQNSVPKESIYRAALVMNELAAQSGAGHRGNRSNPTSGAHHNNNNNNNNVRASGASGVAHSSMGAALLNSLEMRGNSGGSFLGARNADSSMSSNTGGGRSRSRNHNGNGSDAEDEEEDEEGTNTSGNANKGNSNSSAKNNNGKSSTAGAGAGGHRRHLAIEEELELEVFHSFQAHFKYILKVAISPCLKYLITCCADYTIGRFEIPAFMGVPAVAAPPLVNNNNRSTSADMNNRNSNENNNNNNNNTNDNNEDNTSFPFGNSPPSTCADKTRVGTPNITTIPNNNNNNNSTAAAAAADEQASVTNSAGGFTGNNSMVNNKSIASTQAPGGETPNVNAVAVPSGLQNSKEDNSSDMSLSGRPRNNDDDADDNNNDGPNEAKEGDNKNNNNNNNSNVNMSFNNSSANSTSNAHRSTGTAAAVDFNHIEMKPMKPLLGHKRWVWCGAFSSDGRTLVTGGSDSLLMAWQEPAEPRPKASTFAGHAKPVAALALHRYK